MHRRTATKVTDGRVRKKNNLDADRGDYFARPQSEIRLARRGPGPGHRHLLTVKDLRTFLPMLPDWDELARGLDAIVIDGDGSSLSWSDRGLIGIYSWPADLWWEDALIGGYEEVFALLGVEYSPVSDDTFQVRWTEREAHAFQLVRVLPYAMAHHRNEMVGRDTTADDAERYADELLAPLFDGYCTTFGAP